jgi:hypothetical protein
MWNIVNQIITYFTSFFVTHPIIQQINKDKLLIMMKRYPDKVPFLISKKSDIDLSEEKTNELEKDKFLVSKYLTIQHLRWKVSRELKLNNDQKLVFECNNQILEDDKGIDELYLENKQHDNFTRISYIY